MLDEKSIVCNLFLVHGYC